MVEVFTTNINDEFQVKKIIKILEKNFPELDINF
ncbi:hypothetical protein C7447_102435 [Tenacibaculum adriaticum]|uniref:Uncharacterized protein n=1 Tax=Tenacibaculum adriaticum TaxID=413713 RepID=A0A5S5DTB5_9FLAO|nr:hypothetical protein C7447_102435 [Tenacibaculum adriaticum]